MYVFTWIEKKPSTQHKVKKKDVKYRTKYFYETLTDFFERAKCHNLFYKLLHLSLQHFLTIPIPHSTPISNNMKEKKRSHIRLLYDHIFVRTQENGTVLLYTFTLHTKYLCVLLVLFVVFSWKWLFAWDKCFGRQNW